MAEDRVISLDVVRELKVARIEDQAYKARILMMDKHELLEEMVRYQEERKRLGRLTPSLMIRGRTLFAALEESAESEELQILSRSYRRHLDYELRDYAKRKP